MEQPVNVGEQSGGFFSNKRNVLIAAALVGVGIGGIIFLTRKSAPQGQSDSGPTPMDQTALQLSNIANQLSGFRGEQGVYNQASLTRQKDLYDVISAESGRSAEADKQLTDLLTKQGYGLDEIKKAIGDVNSLQQQNLYQTQWFGQQNISYLYNLYGMLFGYHGGNAGAIANLQNSVDAQKGAGGADLWQVMAGNTIFTSGTIPSTYYDGGPGDGSEGAQVMAAAPVRYLGDLRDW